MKIRLDAPVEVVHDGERIPFEAGDHEVSDELAGRLLAQGGTFPPLPVSEPEPIDIGADAKAKKTKK